MPLPDFLPDKTKRTSAGIIMIRRKDNLVRQTFYNSAYKHTACSLNVSAHDGVSGLEKALTEGKRPYVGERRQYILEEEKDLPQLSALQM